MPNHCNNTLKVSGPRAKVWDFARNHYTRPENWDATNVAENPKTTLHLGASVPYPPISEREVWRESTHSGWYSWSIQHWGTKWGAYEVQPETFPEVVDELKANEDWEDDYAEMVYTFTSAWSPPSAWALQASAEYPELTLALGFCEEGCDFMGVEKYRQGSLHHEEHAQPSDFAPEGVDYDDDDQAHAAWSEQSELTNEWLFERI